MRSSSAPVASAPEAAAGKKQRRLSNKERAELAALPARIEALEAQAKQAQAK